jgi:K+-sensing histidine kinase KdpD
LLLRDEIASLPKGSRITFTASLAGDSTSHGRQILMELLDDGPGLPEEALRVMFDPFVVRSDSPQEYGISLMACYFIVHHHGGKIEARKADPHGTVFSVRLLANPNESPPVEENTALLQKVVRHSGVWEKMLASD